MEYADLVWDHNEEAHEQYMKNLAPIILFTYNRLEHTKKTVDALRANIYAKDSVLFIYSDAPKTEADALSVKQVREYLHTVEGFREVQIIRRDENWGLARNIVDGVTQVVNRYGKIIVLEDDIVTSRYFLKYMNDALKIYNDFPKIMNISAYMYPIETKNLPETFFLHSGCCWGWATWKDSWALFERNPEKLVKIFTQDEIYHFNFEGRTDFWQQVLDNVSGKLDTWAVFWDAVIFYNQGLSLAPRDSLIRNVGMDGTGEHCGSTDVYDTQVVDRPVKCFPMTVQELELARARHREFFDRENPDLFRLLVRKWKNSMKKIFERC